MTLGSDENLFLADWKSEACVMHIRSKAQVLSELWGRHSPPGGWVYSVFSNVLQLWHRYIYNILSIGNYEHLLLLTWSLSTKIWVSYFQKSSLMVGFKDLPQPSISEDFMLSIVETQCSNDWILMYILICQNCRTLSGTHIRAEFAQYSVCHWSWQLLT